MPQPRRRHIGRAGPANAQNTALAGRLLTFCAVDGWDGSECSSTPASRRGLGEPPAAGRRSARCGGRRRAPSSRPPGVHLLDVKPVDLDPEPDSEAADLQANGLGAAGVERADDLVAAHRSIGDRLAVRTPPHDFLGPFRRFGMVAARLLRVAVAWRFGADAFPRFCAGVARPFGRDAGPGFGAAGARTGTRPRIVILCRSLSASRALMKAC